MALTPRSRRMSQLTFTLLLAVIAALFAGLVTADGAHGKFPVRYSPFLIEEPVRYEVPLHIASGRGGGRFESEFDASNNTFYQRLTGSSNKPGDILTLVSTSLERISGAPVLEGDSVYVSLLDRRPPAAASRWWGWRKEGDTEWFLVATSKDKRAEFKIVAGGACVRINYCYYLQSCPGSFCNHLAPYPEDEVIYVKLADNNSEDDLPIIFNQVNTLISMPTDA